ncbi:hypothetical protein [Streptomyces europaeiscabiei]|uniref:hypothetical protein n=1 Tax=Streptomyces europaeiscabiei TaxID=146819 RepID=UPI0029A518BE|nr:hypothetical protein [Streptomyces europaeiscabiei]MDX2767052.1 hypothetical protein [Streptomyces europaeiscabiei]
MDPRTQTSTTLELDALDLPDPAGLTDNQRCGRHCCWCPTPTPLTVETAVDLGERRHPMHWFPRCCPTCIRAQARTHGGMCEVCVEEPGACETAAALKQLVREHSR